MSNRARSITLLAVLVLLALPSLSRLEAWAQSVPLGIRPDSGFRVDAKQPSPAASITVPNVVGKKVEAAEAALKAAHLNYKLGNANQTNDAGKYNTVQRQQPTAGQHAPGGTVVVLDVLVPPIAAKPAPPPAAAPVEKTRVPDIVGRDSSVALNMLAAQGLQMAVSRIEPLGGISDRRSGQIAHQEPARSALVDKGSTVRVRVFGTP